MFVAHTNKTGKMETLKFIQLTDLELKNILSDEREKVISRVIELFQNSAQSSNQEKLLTRQATCDYFNISKPCLHDWVKNGILRAVKVGGRVYFKQSDLDLLINKKG